MIVPCGASQIAFLERPAVRRGASLLTADSGSEVRRTAVKRADDCGSIHDVKVIGQIQLSK